MRHNPRSCTNFPVIRELLSPAGVQWNPQCPVLFRLKCVGHVFASVVLLPPRKRILEASKTNVCSLVNTFAYQFATGDAILQLQLIPTMFNREQPTRSHEFKVRPRKYL
jgi:hypothetical protein